MTPNKAREFYSDYLEGTLEGGLRESFERALARDAELQYDFESFKEAMGRLDAVDKSEAAIPEGLLDQISQRVDEAFPVKAAKPRLWLIENLRPVLAVGAAAAVIGLAVISIQNNQGGNVGTADFGPTPVSATPPTVEMKDGSAVFSYKPSATDKVTFKDGDSGEVLASHEIKKGSAFSEPLANPRMEAGVIIIELTSQPENLRIVVPGRMRSADLTSEGTVVDLAKMLSSSFDRPIELRVKNPDRSVAWSFTDGATVPQVSTKLKELNLVLDELGSGMLILTD